jgi:hypothetical protein
MTDLSPAAQAVLDAWENEWSKASLCHDQRSIAAVLRAAAKLIWMDKPLGDTDADAGVLAAHQAIHERLLLIAVELETL